MWFVCEIEDDNKEDFHPDKFSVSSMPDNWTFYKKTQLYCHFPKTNVEQKIKSRAMPVEGSKKWSVFPCRKLMNGEKFATYKQAKEAEKISANYSTLTEYNKAESTPKRGNKNDTSDFKNKKMKTVNIDIVTDTMKIDEEVEIIGNDSFDFNEKMKYGGAYYNKKTEDEDSSCEESDENDQDEFLSSFDIDSDIELESNEFDGQLIHEDDDEISGELTDHSADSVNTTNSKDDQNEFLSECLPSDSLKPEMESKQNNFVSSQESDNSFQLDLRTSRVFTSTLLEDIEPPQENEKLGETAVMGQEVRERMQSMITSIELNISSFMSDVQEQLNELKGIVNANAQHSDSLPSIPPTNVSNEPNTEVEKQNDESLSLPILPNEQNDGVEILNTVPINENRTSAAPHIEDPLPEIEMPVPESDAAPCVMKLPMLKIEHYTSTEKLLKDETDDVSIKTDEEKILENSLIELLVPIKGETEKQYIERTILILFDLKFFVKSITWRIESDKDRACIKDSNILKCWSKSHQTIFDPDKDNKRFKSHFRRIKMRERANLKNQQKKKEKAKK